MEIINSFTDTIKERTKNPFFGTLTLVWLFRNWEVVFAIFNFKEGFGHEDKIAFINKHYENKLLWGIFVNNILIALGLMILGYLLIVLTRVIVNIVERKWMPYLNEKTDNTLVVSKERFIDVKRTRDEYAQSNDDLQELLIQSQQKLSQQKLESERLSKQVESLDTENSLLHNAKAKEDITLKESLRTQRNLNDKVNGLEHDLQTFRETIDKLQRNKFQFTNALIEYLSDFKISESNRNFSLLNNVLRHPYRQLESNNQVERFVKFYERIVLRQNELEVGDKDLEYFQNHKLVYIEGNVVASTPDGDMAYLLAKSKIGQNRGMGL